MYESESEDELVGNIIKVFVTSKDNPKKVSKEAKKYIIPKILVSDFTDYYTRDLYIESDENTDKLFFTQNDNEFLTASNEFESEPSELMPETFMSFLSSCKSLIGDVVSYRDDRVPADEWIALFDKNINDAAEEEKKQQEKERLWMIKLEEKRLRMERRKQIRKINKPLINIIPVNLPKLTGASAHERVCVLPLIVLKKRLKLYSQSFDPKFIHHIFKHTCSYITSSRSTMEVSRILSFQFAKYMQDTFRIIRTTTQLKIDGIHLIGINSQPKEVENSIEDDEIKNGICDHPTNLEEILNVKFKPKHRRFQEVNYNLKWRYVKEDGTIRENNFDLHPTRKINYQSTKMLKNITSDGQKLNSLKNDKIKIYKRRLNFDVKEQKIELKPESTYQIKIQENLLKEKRIENKPTKTIKGSPFKQSVQVKVSTQVLFNV